MSHCPKCKTSISDNINADASEGQIAEYVAGYRECICGWEGYINAEPKAKVGNIENKNISRRNINARRFEDSFLSRCDKKGWTIEKGNLFATYLLSQQHLRNKLARKKSKIILKAIQTEGLDEQLEHLLEENLCEQNEFYPEDAFKINGLPDFIILTPHDKLPIWVEVKFGASKLSPIQKKIKKRLEVMGFRYYIFKGGSISEFERQLKL